MVVEGCGRGGDGDFFGGFLFCGGHLSKEANVKYDESRAPPVRRLLFASHRSDCSFVFFPPFLSMNISQRLLLKARQFPGAQLWAF